MPPTTTGSAQQILTRKYGNPSSAGWESKWMTTWEVKADYPWYPSRRIYIHKDFKKLLFTAFKDLQTLDLQSQIKTFDGCFNIRLVRGSRSVYSIHSWGCAIDMNASQNPLGSNGKWSADFISVMVNNNIYCGQNWLGRKDPMHFALVNG